ncbi:MAG: sigma-70 family RNA polymerase sigma factor [Chloroflexi bacterium]|uniref:Sigma-70 family RNA polymerase sigma factor n=1 Tax=Candidatus Chlorohelix allophototropha TaxID=3003348 RepID=A0A8T7LR99_9CHLR|nr:sigma-70 family RNA polymerase sigma factor [Chloroflexota bacterium]WJW66411.1 sigma-70 family RNA polymerase sigma factor [Chloroflexota bacterium L227-S17]
MERREGDADKKKEPDALSLSKPDPNELFGSEVNYSADIPPEPNRSGENDEGAVTSATFAAKPFTSTFPFARTNNINRVEQTATANPVSEANRKDENLVQQVLGGNQDAFAQLIERYKVAVFNLCARMLNDQNEAEDASQEVFLRAYNQLHTYQAGRRFSTWILSIASHYCIDMLRRRRPVTDLDSIAFWKPSDLPEPEESAVISENRDEVRELLRKLPEKYRSVTILRYWQDLSYEEIAETTGLTIATVKTRLFRARELLAKELDKQHRNGGDAGSRSKDEKKFLRGRFGLNSAKTKTTKGDSNVLP